MSVSDDDDRQDVFEEDENPFEKKRRGYEVGYGKPPRQHRFRKGNKAATGKRKRPKDRGMARAILKIADENIAVLINGKRVRMSRKEALVRQLFEKAIKSPRDGLRMLQLLLGIEEEEALQPRQSTVTIEFVKYRPEGLPGRPAEFDTDKPDFIEHVPKK